MVDSDSLADFDAGAWKTRDKAWMAERQARWPELAAMLFQKSGKGLGIVKQYYLKGKLPNWQRLGEWTGSGSYRHLDFFSFLWLHPSWDESVLRELRDRYLKSEYIIADDVYEGISLFQAAAFTTACSKLTDRSSYDWPYADGHNELLFELLIHEVRDAVWEISNRFKFAGRRRPSVIKIHPRPMIDAWTLSQWLCIPEMLPMNEDMVMQYDHPLEWWFECRGDDAEDYWTTALGEMDRLIVAKALLRIRLFETDREGDSPRTRFVLKMRRLLDERRDSAALTDMWEQVKTGEISFNDPWGTQYGLASDPRRDRLSVSALSGGVSFVFETVPGLNTPVRCAADGAFSSTVNDAQPLPMMSKNRAGDVETHADTVLAKKSLGKHGVSRRPTPSPDVRVATRFASCASASLTVSP